MSDRNEAEAKRRQYTEEFKTEAVRLLDDRSGDVPPISVADVGYGPIILMVYDLEYELSCAM